MAAGRLPAFWKVPTHHRWEGCVFVCVCVCVCVCEAISGCVNRKGMGPGCAQVCIQSQLWNTACRRPASCLQAHGAPRLLGMLACSEHCQLSLGACASEAPSLGRLWGTDSPGLKLLRRRGLY